MYFAIQVFGAIALSSFDESLDWRDVKTGIKIAQAGVKHENMRVT